MLITESPSIYNKKMDKNQKSSMKFTSFGKENQVIQEFQRRAAKLRRQLNKLGQKEQRTPFNKLPCECFCVGGSPVVI